MRQRIINQDILGSCYRKFYYHFSFLVVWGCSFAQTNRCLLENWTNFQLWLAVKRTSRIHSHQAWQKKIAASNISFLKQVSHPCISTKVIYPLLISVNLDVFLEAYILSFLYLFSKHVRFISKAHLWSQGLNLCGTPGGDFPPSAAGGNNHYFNPWLTGGWWISTLNFAGTYIYIYFLFEKMSWNKKVKDLSGVVDCFMSVCPARKPDAYLPFASSKFKETNINSIKSKKQRRKRGNTETK